MYTHSKIRGIFLQGGAWVKKESMASLPHTSLYYIYISIQLHQPDKKKAQGSPFLFNFGLERFSAYKACLTFWKKKKKERNSNPVLDACRKIMLSTPFYIPNRGTKKWLRTLKGFKFFICNPIFFAPGASLQAEVFCIKLDIYWSGFELTMPHTYQYGI